jgi:hypothetical protein
MPNAKNAHETTAKKFLLLGKTGSGKTSQLLTLPGKKFAYLFDPNAILSLQGHDVDYEEFMPDRLNLSVKSLSKDKPSDKTTNHQSLIYQKWEKDFDDRVKGGFFDTYDVIAIDSMTTFLDLIMDRVLTINGRAGSWPQQDDYGPQMTSFINVCRQLTALNKVIFMTGHIETRQDELTKRIFNQPMMTGRLKVKVPLLFSDIFVCSTEIGQNGKVSHKIQTTPDRLTDTVRTTIKGLDPFEDVTIDWSKDPVGQGLGSLLSWEKGNVSK